MKRDDDWRCPRCKVFMRAATNACRICGELSRHRITRKTLAERKRRYELGLGWERD